jgi:membrane fusion protein, multidrug efflux system
MILMRLCRLAGSFFWRLPKRAGVAICLMAATTIFWGCSGDATGNPKNVDSRKKVVVPVVVAKAVEKTMPVQLEAIGNVLPYATVLVRSRVGGELVGVHFQEGEEVNAGDLLFTIDPRPYEAQVRQAEANLARNRALLQAARKQADRYGAVVKKGYVSEDQHDQIASNAAALEASVRAGEAALDTARLDLKYCSIRAPVSGVTGQLKVNRGNLVKASDNDNPLVVINQIRPIYVVFSVPERNLPELRRHLAARKMEAAITVPGEEQHLVQGELKFLDNSVDQTTGTILLRATFENYQRSLWPGQFVNVVVTLANQEGVVVIPSQAVQTGQKGQYVYILGADSVAEYRPVVISRAVAGETVITQGVSAGDLVITDGQLRLTQGSQVRVVENGTKNIEVKPQ